MNKTEIETIYNKNTQCFQYIKCIDKFGFDYCISKFILGLQSKDGKSFIQW